MGVRSAVAGALLLAAAAAAATAQLPQTWPRCRRRDANLDVCLQHAIQVTIPQLASGVPDLDFPPLEAMTMNEGFTIERKPGRISLQIKLSNVIGHGMTSAKVISVFSDLDIGVIDIYLTVPLVALSADLEVEGSILHEPVSPQRGTANITFYDPTGILVVGGAIVERDGDSYLDVNYTQGTMLSLSGLDIHFNPLDKSPQRSSKLNYLLNSNALALWPGIREGIEKTYSEGFRKMANIIFSKVPLKDIFLADDHPAVQAGPSSLLVFGR